MGPVNPKIGFSYTAPTQNTDGSTLDPSKIVKYQIGIGIASGVYPIIVDDVTIEAGVLQVSPISLIGQLTFGQKYAAVRVVTDDNKTSGWSDEVQFVLEAATPNPPTDFLVS